MDVGQHLAARFNGSRQLTTPLGYYSSCRNKPAITLKPICRRNGFTLVELVVVVMILGILAAIAAPKVLGTSDRAVDNGLRQTLGVIRTAIDSYAAEHAGALPGADGQEQSFKDDLAAYLRGSDFPASPVGAKNNQIRMMAGTGSIVPGIAATAATQSWVCKYETGDFYVNNNELSADDTTTYDEF